MEFIKIKMPNGIKITAIVIETIADSLLCYAQNRLFLVDVHIKEDVYHLKKIIAEYCIIPEYDDILFK